MSSVSGVKRILKVIKFIQANISLQDEIGVPVGKSVKKVRKARKKKKKTYRIKIGKKIFD